MKEIIYAGLTIILTVLTVTSYIPQMIKIIRTKSVKDLSLAAWFIYDLYFALYILLLLLDSAGFGLIFVALLECIQCVIITLMIIYYKKDPLSK